MDSPLTPQFRKARPLTLDRAAVWRSIGAMTEPFPARTLASPTGATLQLYHCEATTKPRGVIHINHGLAEHAARYERFATFLAARGYHVYAHDHRGHGHTTADDERPRTFARRDGASKILADVDIVQDLISGIHPKLPAIIFGHSMGGLIALNYVFKHSNRVAGAAIWNANFSAGLLGRAGQALLAFERFRRGSDVPSRILPKLTFEAWAKQVENARTGFDWLSRDPAEVDAYVADPLCGWDASVSMWQDVFALVFAGADDSNFADVPRALPFNLVGGAEDPATDGGKAVETLDKRMRGMGFSDVTTTIYPATRHETLNEINRTEAMEAFAAFADRITGSQD